MQHIVNVDISVRDRRARQGKRIGSALRNRKSRVSLLSANTFNAMDFVEHQKRTLTSDLAELLGDANSRLVIHEQQVAATYTSTNIAPTVGLTKLSIRIILRRKQAERPLIAKAQSPLCRPGIKCVFRAHDHNAIDHAASRQKGKCAQHGRRFTRPRNREVTRAPHCCQEERVAHLAILKRTRHGGIDDLRELCEMGIVLVVAAFDLISQARTLLGKLANLRKAVLQVVIDR